MGNHEEDIQTMSIRRAPRGEHFTVLSNEVLEASDLSFKAKGLLAYILSKPDHWRCASRQLASIGPDGKAAVLTALEELQLAGYARYENRRDPDTGTWSPEWEVSDYRTVDRFPGYGESAHGKPSQVVRTDRAKTERASRLPDSFIVTAEMEEWARREAPNISVSRQTERFVDYWRGNGKTKVDWLATWRNWMRRASDDAGPRRTEPRRLSQGDRNVIALGGEPA